MYLISVNIVAIVAACDVSAALSKIFIECDVNLG